MTEYAPPALEIRKTVFNYLMGDEKLVDTVKKIGAGERDTLEVGDEVKAGCLFGNVDFDFMAKAFDLIQSTYGGPLPEDSTFCDIGSGLGHAVFAAALLFPFKQVIGCEILPGVMEKAKLIETKYFDTLNAKATDAGDAVPEDARKCEITFVGGNAAEKLDETIVNGVSVIFCVATALPDSVLEAVYDAANGLQGSGEPRCQPGTFIITLSRMMPERFLTDWTVCAVEKHAVPWGTATMFVHRKNGFPFQE